MHLLLNRFNGGAGIQASSSRHIQVLAPGSIASKDGVDNAQLAFLSGFKQDCAGSIAEKYAGRAILEIDDGRHHVCTDDNYFLVGSGLNKLGAGRQRVEEAGAGAGQIKPPGFGGVDFGLNEAGAGGRKTCRA